MWGQEQLRVKVVGTRGKRSKLLPLLPYFGGGGGSGDWRRASAEPRRGALLLSSPTIQSSFLFISEHFSGRFNSSYLHVVSLLGFRFSFLPQFRVVLKKALNWALFWQISRLSIFSLDHHHHSCLSLQKIIITQNLQNFAFSCQAILKTNLSFSSFDHSRRAKGERRRLF